MNCVTATAIASAIDGPVMLINPRNEDRDLRWHVNERIQAGRIEGSAAAFGKEHAVETDDDRNLNQQDENGGERVHLFLFEERHRPACPIRPGCP